MITSNVIHRVFQLRYRNGLGTCFAIDVDDRQYIVTATHVVPSIGTSGKIGLYKEGQVHEHDARLVGMAQGDVDISVLALDELVAAPELQLPATTRGATYGQDMYYLGFPLGLKSDIVFSTGFPLALVKKACLSGFLQGSGKQLSVLLLDAHINPGFSGGPLVFVPLGGPLNKLVVAGVIASHKILEEPTFRHGQKTGIVYRAHTGIGLAYSIEHALDIIRGNPIGVPTK
jgi:S1-C subfamily serine protease